MTYFQQKKSDANTPLFLNLIFSIYFIPLCPKPPLPLSVFLLISSIGFNVTNLPLYTGIKTAWAILSPFVIQISLSDKFTTNIQHSPI